MDISFNQENQKFNYRVCAMIISENRLLAMHDERSPYFYLPGEGLRWVKRPSRRWYGKSGRNLA